MQQGEHGLNYIQSGMKNFTVKLLLCLCLILARSNAYAWYCSYTPTAEGYISNLQCYDISNAEALAIAWCPYRPQDPICGAPVQPACTDRTETQSIGCPVHHSGAINQVRTYQCSSQSFTDWTTASNNCTPDPPSCQTSVEERQVACNEGYTGSISEQRQSSCPDPYGQPIFGVWVETQRSCQMTTSNPMNVSSPVSPISPVNPIAAPAPPVAEAPPPVPVEMQVPAEAPPPTVAPKQEVSSSATTSSPTATKTETKTEAKVETKSESKQEAAPVSVPKGKELVGGFGLVMSLEILNNPITFQQQQLEIALDYSQELPYELRGNQGVLLQFITESNTADTFNRIASDRWNSLRSNYEVQPDY